MAETKPKPNSSLRTPGPKKKLGLSVPPALRMPHDDLILSAKDSEARDEATLLPSMTSLTSHTTPTTQTSHTTPTSQTSHTTQTTPKPETPAIAPQRDFTKVANSIGRQAVPAGLFTGKSKQLYDCLYSLTRGAIVPTLSIRISRPRLMSKAHIGSRVTFDANIERLISVGLVSVRQITGEHEGNEYTVHLPEEAVLSMPSQTSQSSQTSHAQKVDRLVRLETSQTRHSLSLEESTTSEGSKTFIKTIERSDDEPAAALAERFAQAERELTGRNGSQPQQWVELAEVLVAELRIAAARTTVSSVPSFLAEHLRRRLWKLDKKQAHAEGRELPDQPSATPDAAPSPLECPDCKGSGWWYPQGPDQGVARCKHSNLTSASPTGPS